MLGLLIELAIVVIVILVIVFFVFRLISRFVLRKIVEGASYVNEKQSEAFEKEYLAEPISTEKMQRKLTFMYYRRWARLIISCLMMASIAVPVVILAQIGPMGFGDFLLLTFPFVVIAIVGFFLALSTNINKFRTKQLVSLITEPALKETFGNDVSYELSNHIPDELIRAANFVEIHSIYGSDLVRCHYKGLPIMFSDIEIQKEEVYRDAETNEEKTRYVRVFKGFWIVAELGRELSSVPMSIVTGSDRDAIQTESIEFNNKYAVHCQDEHTAFYILTPHFMEHLLEVDRKAKGKTYFQFDKNKLQFAVSTGKDLFETRRFQSPKVDEMRGRFRAEVKQVTDAIDNLIQDEKFFMDTAN